MEYAYFCTIEVRTKKALSEDQQEKLREAILLVMDCADIPYVYDVVTATFGGEEKLG